MAHPPKLRDRPEDAASIDKAINEPVAIVPSDARWPAAFAVERERLLARFAPQLLQIEHIGSTAVPGLAAKPIIDILAGVESMAVADALFEPLLANGYTTSRAFNAALRDRRWFMRVADGRRTHHLHLVELGGPPWHARLRFRDALRESADLAQRYGALKQALAQRHGADREAYTDAKADFVASVVGRD